MQLKHLRAYLKILFREDLKVHVYVYVCVYVYVERERKV